MTKNFYRSFEETYRGPRDLIKHRAQVYLPLLKALVQMNPASSALDMGCGRGEWLEVLTEQGISANGVDIDPDMLNSARELGLNVVQADALSYLLQQTDESLMLVSAFHLVEHLPFEDIRQLAAQAMRVLKPGGLLILETPNPENMVVGTSEFYLDPTHLRPIPPKLLAFVPRYFGFSRTKIVRLQESADLAGPEDVTLKQVLDGVSPDYAVVAQKGAENRILELADPFFNREYGVSFDVLVARYDRQNRQRRELEQTIVHHAEARAAAVEKLAARVQDEADQFQSQLNAVYNSLSWRITRPLRLLKSLLKRSGPAGSSPLPGTRPEQADMPPTAGRIYTDLKDAVDRRDRKKTDAHRH